MYIKELTTHEFTTFQKNHSLSNYHQTLNYAMLMSENGYEYDLIGYIDDFGNIIAATLILLKPIGFKCFYGYAPRGFLIDYDNDSLVNNFTNALKKYYYEKNVIFIKINPNIKINEIDNKTFEKNYNHNEDITYNLINNGYKKLKDNLYFEAQLPRFKAIIDLKNDDSKYYDKNTKNKIKKGIRKGLTFEKCSKDEIHYFYEFIKNKKDKNEYYYQDYYTVFEKDDSIDLFLISVDYNSFLQNSHYLYNEELEKNTLLNEKLTKNNGNRIINAKMNSDKNLLSYKNDIMEATKCLSDNNKIYIAGALVIKHNDTATVIMSGYDKNYKRFSANYFLYYSLIKYYKNDYNYLDINGVVGDFTNENPYTGLNRFKLGFNPYIYEYIGEYDLIINEKSYQILLSNGTLAKEFNKKDIKK